MGETATTWPPPVRHKNLAARIKLARLEASLTLDQLANQVGSTRQHLIKLEKGWHAPRLELRIKLAEALGQSVEYFQPDD